MNQLGDQLPRISIHQPNDSRLDIRDKVSIKRSDFLRSFLSSSWFSQNKILLIVVSLLCVGMISALLFFNRSQDIRQLASGGSCAIFSSQADCSSVGGCSWSSYSCGSFSAQHACTSAGCNWSPTVITCSNLNETQCTNTFNCAWRPTTVACSMDQGCDQHGCSLNQNTTTHACSFDDNNCSQAGCSSVIAHCSGSYQIGGQCTGQHSCGLSACSTHTNRSACEDSCCTWSTGTANCNVFGQGSCQQTSGCSWNQAVCSGSYTRTSWSCEGSYISGGSCQGSGVQLSGSCAGTPSTPGICEGTIILPTRTPTPVSNTPTPVSTIKPTPPPGVCQFGEYACLSIDACVECDYRNNLWGYFITANSNCGEPCGSVLDPEDEVVQMCHILIGEVSCPQGMIRDDGCYEICEDNNVICCVDIDPNTQQACTRGDRECCSQTHPSYSSGSCSLGQYRQCQVNDPQGTSGVFSSWRDCPDGWECNQGLCVQLQPTPEPTEPPEFAGGECEESQRECNDNNQYRYCIYNPTTGVAGLWSGWRDCGLNANCAQGVCIQHTPTPILTPTPTPTPTLISTLTPVPPLPQRFIPPSNELEADCSILAGEANCPQGTVVDNSCHSACIQNQLICCRQVSQQQACTRGVRECLSNNQYRYCVVEGGSTATNGRWSNPITCSEGYVCNQGLCLKTHPSPGAKTTTTGFEECDKGARMCDENNNRFKYCVYDEGAELFGFWSEWKDCAYGTRCRNGECVSESSLIDLIISPTPIYIGDEIPEHCLVLPGEPYCPSGYMKDQLCHVSCNNSNVLCCVKVGPEDQCNRGDRECRDRSGIIEQRYCIVDGTFETSGKWSKWRACGANTNCYLGVCVQSMVYGNALKENFENCFTNEECKSGFCDGICMPVTPVGRVTEFGVCQMSEVGKTRCIEGNDTTEKTLLRCQEVSGQEHPWWFKIGDECHYPGYHIIPDGYDSPAARVVLDNVLPGITVIYCYPGITDQAIIRACDFLYSRGWLAMTHEDLQATMDVACYPPGCQFWNARLLLTASAATAKRVSDHENIHNIQAMNDPNLGDNVSGRVDENNRRHQEPINMAYQSIIEGAAEDFSQVGGSGYEPFRQFYRRMRNWAEANDLGNDFYLASMGHWNVFNDLIDQYTRDTGKSLVEKLTSVGFRGT